MESVIAYTDRLWKSLDRRPVHARRRVSMETRGRLAPWVATLTRCDGRGYAIAVAAHSGLTLVFETSSADAFKPAMVAALRAAFEDLDIPSPMLSKEIADIECAAFVRLRDAVVGDELDFIEALCATDAFFPDNLRRVQLNLDDFPRQRQIPYEPRLAAPLLFGVLSGTARIH